MARKITPAGCVKEDLQLFQVVIFSEIMASLTCNRVLKLSKWPRSPQQTHFSNFLLTLVKLLASLPGCKTCSAILALQLTLCSVCSSNPTNLNQTFVRQDKFVLFGFYLLKELHGCEAAFFSTASHLVVYVTIKGSMIGGLVEFEERGDTCAHGK